MRSCWPNGKASDYEYSFVARRIIHFIYYYVVHISQQQQLSEDSGFDSRAGLSQSCWPNGKASDYE